MLKVIMRTEVPKEYSKTHHKDFMTLQRVQADLKGKIKAFVIVRSGNSYEPVIIENHECRLSKILLNSGVIVLHAQIKKDEAVWILTCTWDEFRKLVSSLDNLKLKYEILSKTRFLEGSKLTQKELDVLKLALECGYFENPKKVKLKEIARMLDVSEATASILIRRALKKVVEQTIIKNVDYEV